MTSTFKNHCNTWLHAALCSSLLTFKCKRSLSALCSPLCSPPSLCLSPSLFTVCLFSCSVSVQMQEVVSDERLWHSFPHAKLLGERVPVPRRQCPRLSASSRTYSRETLAVMPARKGLLLLSSLSLQFVFCK